MQLRPYQQLAVNAILADLNRPGNTLAVLPCGAGKTHIISELSARLNSDILIFAPSKELIEQDRDKLLTVVPQSNVGIYSASMNEKTIRKFTVASIGSVYKKPELFERFKLIICDECHLISPKENSMYQKFFRAVGNPKIIALTGTPFRLFPKVVTFPNRGNKRMFTTVTEIRLLMSLPKPLFTDIVYNLDIEYLQKEGYLSKLQYFDNHIIDHSSIPLNKSATDFDLGAYETLISSREDGIMDIISRAQQKFSSVLVFAVSVEQAKRISSVVKFSAIVSSDTPKQEREQILSDFKTGKIQTVINYGVLTTGFDFPDLRCIITARPTRSLSLWIQCVGRGLRLSEGKEHCTIIDTSGNLKALGTIESIKTIKENGKWELISSKGRWNKKELYRFNIEIHGKKNMYGMSIE